MADKCSEISCDVWILRKILSNMNSSRQDTCIQTPVPKSSSLPQCPLSRVPAPSVMVLAPGTHPTNVNVISLVLNVTNVVLLRMGVYLMACSSYQAVHNIVRSANINIKPKFSREYYLVNTRYQLELQTIHRF